MDQLDSVPTHAVAAASTWRAFHRPRMALAVLAVSLQHIAAHSSHHHHHQQPSQGGRSGMPLKDPVEETSENDADDAVTPPTSEAPLSPAPVVEVRASSLDEGIEPDR